MCRRVEKSFSTSTYLREIQTNVNKFLESRVYGLQWLQSTLALSLSISRLFPRHWQPELFINVRQSETKFPSTHRRTFPADYTRLPLIFQGTYQIKSHFECKRFSQSYLNIDFPFLCTRQWLEDVHVLSSHVATIALTIIIKLFSFEHCENLFIGVLKRKNNEVSL